MFDIRKQEVTKNIAKYGENSGCCRVSSLRDIWWYMYKLGEFFVA